MADEKIHITDLQELDTLTQNCMVMVDDGTNSYKYDANKFGQGGGGGGSSSGVYVEDELYIATSINFVNIPVDWNWNDYDLYIFRVNNALPSSENGQTMVLTKRQVYENIQNETQQYFPKDGDYGCNYYFAENQITARTNNGFVIISIRGIKMSGDYFSPIIYSTEEREVGVWADGKPLYQKTLIDTTALSGNSKVIDISSLNAEFVQVINCELVDVSGYYSPITWFNGDNQYYAYINSIGDSQIEIGYSSQIAVNRGSNGYIMTIQYTKTTDTAGSGSYNTLGVPKVHYSTSEQVIGTWIDGSIIYQRTFEFSSPVSVRNEWVNTTIDSTGIDKIIRAVGYHSDGTCYSDISADPTKSNHTVVGIEGYSQGTVSILVLEYTKL